MVWVRGDFGHEFRMTIVTSTFVAFGSLFPIVDPVAAVPVFLALVGNQSRPVQTRIALRAALTCFFVLAVFGFAGTFIFKFFTFLSKN